MKKLYVLALTALFISAGSAWAEEAAAPVASEAVPVETTATPAPVEAAPVAETAAPAEAPVVAAEAAPADSVAEPVPAENLEFVSGEVSALDEAAKSITIKLYGETEAGAQEKTLTVTLDETTDITDGEKDRDLKSLTSGTEVDVEYDPASNKATYIFVY